MLTRRVFLKAGGMALVTIGAGPAFLNRAALAAPAPGPHVRRKVLVTIFQRGAMDGMMAVTPLDDATLKQLRPRLAMSAARAAGDSALADLGVGFGLHPGFSALLPFWQERRLAIVHAVGSPDPTRSHFDAQDYMETGTPGRKGTPSGWLNRAVGLLGHDRTPFRAVAMTPSLPRSLYGEEPAVAVTNLADFRVRLPGADQVAVAAGQGFETLYERASQSLLRSTGTETFEAIDVLSATDIAHYQPANGASYPKGPLGDAMRQIALLIKSDVGLEVAFAESGGWDTHVQQGAVDQRLLDRPGLPPGRRAAHHHDRVRPHGARERVRRHRPRPRLLPVRARQPRRRRQGARSSPRHPPRCALRGARPAGDHRLPRGVLRAGRQAPGDQGRRRAVPRLDRPSAADRPRLTGRAGLLKHPPRGAAAPAGPRFPSSNVRGLCSRHGAP
jgi:uncharacterized protein (DUF1501 family)